MSSFNGTCAVTQLPILRGDKVAEHSDVKFKRWDEPEDKA